MHWNLIGSFWWKKIIKNIFEKYSFKISVTIRPQQNFGRQYSTSKYKFKFDHMSSFCDIEEEPSKIQTQNPIMKKLSY